MIARPEKGILPYTEAARACGKQLYPDLRPLAVEGPRERVYGAALASARALGWEIVEESGEKGRIAAVAITKILRFRDDIAIEVRPAGARAWELHVRSKSRLGRDDFGANVKRIRQFFARFQTEYPGSRC